MYVALYVGCSICMLLCMDVPSMRISLHVYVVLFVGCSLCILHCMYVSLYAWSQYVCRFVCLSPPYICPFCAFIFFMCISPPLYALCVYVFFVRMSLYMSFPYICLFQYMSFLLYTLRIYILSVRMSSHIYTIHIYMALCIGYFVYILLCVYAAPCPWVYYPLYIPLVYISFLHSYFLIFIFSIYMSLWLFVTL